MADELQKPAPRWRQTCASLLDAALGAGVARILRARVPGEDARRRFRGGQALASAFAREQIGTPGQRLLGMRTVDERTGRRPVLSRTLVLLAAAAASEALVRSLEPRPDPEREARRREFHDGLAAVARRERENPDRAEVLARYAREHRPEPAGDALVPAVVPRLAAGLFNVRLRKRLAPTREILVRDRASHSP